MPLYDYQCGHCKAVFEVRATCKEKEAGLQLRCPECHGKKTHQLLTSGLFLRQTEDGQSVTSPTCGPNCGRGSCATCGN
jgi:putative FmdB family regulatory protein